MHIDFLREQVPDATTLLKFRHLLEQNGIGEQIFADVNARLEAAGLMMHGGTIVDATLIAAPPSTKNKEGKRDPEMHQAKKGNQWPAREHLGRYAERLVLAGRVRFTGMVPPTEVQNYYQLLHRAECGSGDDESGPFQALYSGRDESGIPAFVTTGQNRRVFTQDRKRSQITAVNFRLKLVWFGCHPRQSCHKSVHFRTIWESVFS